MLGVWGVNRQEIATTHEVSEVKPGCKGHKHGKEEHRCSQFLKRAQFVRCPNPPVANDMNPHTLAGRLMLKNDSSFAE